MEDNNQTGGGGSTLPVAAPTKEEKTPVAPPKPLDLAAFSGEIVIERTWEAVAPGTVFRFKHRMYLSNELAARREATIGLNPDERKANLTDFKIRVLADTLIEPPEGFVGFPDTATVGGQQSQLLPDRAYEFLSTRDGAGNYKLYWLLQTVFEEYWERALPSAYFRGSSDNGKGSGAVQLRDS